MKQRPCLLAALLAAYAALAGVYSLVTPLFEAPDEVWHYAYVRYVAERRALPALTDSDSGAYQEVAQPPLYYAAAALLSGLARDDDLPDLMWHNPGFGYQAGGTVNDNKNMLIHTERERFPWRGAVLAIRLARLASLLFGVATVAAAYGLACEAFPARPGLALSAAAVVAFTPQFLFISGVASNDSAAAALSTAALWTMARILRRGVTLRRTCVLGLLVGLAILTKTSALLLLPTGMLVLLARRGRFIAHSGTRNDADDTDSHLFSSRKSVFFRVLLCPTAIFLLIAALVGGWWYLRNALLFHDPLAVGVHENTPWGRAAPAPLPLLLAQLPVVYRSFWGAFGWGHVEFPPWVYLTLSAPIVLSLGGWGAWLGTRNHADHTDSPKKSALFRVLPRPIHLPGEGAVFLLCAGWGGATFAALLQWMRQVEAPHGRLLFPAIAACAVLLVAGWASLPPPRITHYALRITHYALLPLFLSALLAPWTTIRPAFAPPRLLRPAEAAARVEGASLLYGDAARLLGAAVKPQSTTPGGVLTVRACWESLAPLERDYTVFVHLVGKNNLRVGERHTYPGLGRFPTSRWVEGWAFCDDYRVRVAEWAAAPELYDVVIGLYDAPTGERLSVRTPEGAPVGLPILAQARVAPAEPLPLPEDARRVDFRLGEQIALVGYRISGPPLTITLYWRALAQPTEDYTVFVHLLGEAAPGEPLAQHDGPPRAGRYPTSAWRRGDLVPDEHVLDATPDGEAVRLAVGMYRPATGERLPVAGPAGAVEGGAILLPLR